jgi:hypothetical protein
MKCSEKSCPFPANEGEQLCRYHEQLFALDISPSELSVQATDEDISSAIFYDQSITITTRRMLSLDEWIENKAWQKKRHRAYESRRRDRNRAKGLCHCGKMRTAGRKLCFDHYRRGIEQFSRRRQRGVCVGCGKRPPETGKIRCEFCLDKAHRSYAKNLTAQKRATRKAGAAGLRASRIESGACADCGGSRDDSTKLTCGACRGKNNNSLSKLRKKRLSAGLCFRCGRKKRNRSLENCRRCERKKRARRFAQRGKAYRRKESVLRWDRHRKSAAYNSRLAVGACPYCGGTRNRPGRTICAGCSNAKSEQSRRRQQRKSSAARGGGEEVGR